MNPFSGRWLLAAVATFGLGGNAVANDYPTVDRVVYVRDCMRQHPGPEFEMLSKCSCALDALARSMPFDEFTTLRTATLANSIGGERGNVIRDTEMLQKEIRRFREAQANAKKGCFILSDPVDR